MIGRLVYEVRLRKTVKSPRKWRWDVQYMLTTDPEFPGVETGRKEIGSDWGYERFKWQAKKKIADSMMRNRWRYVYDER